MTTIATITSLLPIFFTEYQEVKLISELNKFFDFDHNIFLMDSSTDKNRYVDIRGRDVTPQTVYVFESVEDNITELERLPEIKSKNSFTVVVPNSSNFDRNVNLLNRLKEVQRLQTNMKIGMFFSHLESKDDLQTLFEWCRKQLIVNIFAATYTYPSEVSPDRSLNIFTFPPFGTFKVTKVSDRKAYKSYFLSLNSNFHQHQLRLGHSFDFNMDKEFWLTVFRLMNASFMVVLDNFTGEDLVERGIDVIPHLYVKSDFTGNCMYPLVVEAQVILVPEALPYSEFSAYLRTLTSDEFFGYSLLIISAVILLLIVVRYIKQKKILFFQSVVDVLNLLMNDNGNIMYQRLYRVEGFLIVPLTFVGLVVVNGILSNLQSYLTRPILQPQIKTIEDIYKSPFPIFTFNEKWRRQLTDALTDLSKHEDWNAKTFVIVELEYWKQIEMFNRSMSFMTIPTYANMLLGLQKRMDIKGYHNPRIQFFNSLFTYDVFNKFIFFERLNEIVHRIQSAGLYDLWGRQDVALLGDNILKTNDNRWLYQNGTVVEQFKFPLFIAYGWFASVIVLVTEIFLKKFKLTSKNLPMILARKLRDCRP